MNSVAVIGSVGQSVFLPVKNFHTGGETVTASDIHTEPGGKGFNQAVAAARCGADVAFLAAVGGDGYKKTIADFLKQEGIHGVLAEKPGATAYAAILTDSAGSNRVTVYLGASLDPADAVGFVETIAPFDILLLSNEVPEAVNIAAATAARTRGAKIVLNPAPQQTLSEEMLSLVDWFTPNEHETAGLEGRRNVIETLGSRGCRIRATGETVPAFLVKAVDTTGAGDTFNGALAAALAAGRPLRDAVWYANAAAAVSVTGRYAVSSIPNAETIEKFLSKQGGKTQ